MTMVIDGQRDSGPKYFLSIIQYASDDETNSVASEKELRTVLSM